MIHESTIGAVFGLTLLAFIVGANRMDRLARLRTSQADFRGGAFPGLLRRTLGCVILAIGVFALAKCRGGSWMPTIDDAMILLGMGLSSRVTTRWLNRRDDGSGLPGLGSREFQFDIGDLLLLTTGVAGLAWFARRSSWALTPIVTDVPIVTDSLIQPDMLPRVCMWLGVILVCTGLPIGLTCLESAGRRSPRPRWWVGAIGAAVLFGTVASLAMLDAWGVQPGRLSVVEAGGRYAAVGMGMLLPVIVLNAVRRTGDAKTSDMVPESAGETHVVESEFNASVAFPDVTDRRGPIDGGLVGANAADRRSGAGPRLAAWTTTDEAAGTVDVFG